MALDQKSAATTIRSWADRLRAAGLSFLAVGSGMWLLIDGFDRPGWAKHVLVPVVAVCLAATGLAVTWRICRMGVRFDEEGVTVEGILSDLPA